MRRIQKIGAWLLTFVMIFSCLTAFAVGEAQEDSNTPPQVYEEELKLISALGIYSFASENHADAVTRGEFAHMVTELLSAEGAASGNEAYFYDVTEETAYRADISAAAALGIMSGMGDGTFRPDRHITYVQAVKTLVSALGYHPLAKGTGGYASGYLACADEVGLLKGAPSDYNTDLTFDMAVKLIYNALDAKVFEIIAVSGDMAAYTTSPDRRLLGVYHDIYTGKGRITDNGITKVDGKSTCGLKNVVIDERVYANRTKAARELLGLNVEYYYKEDGQSRELLYVMENTGKNTVVTLKAKDLVTDASKFGKSCVVAMPEDKTEEYDIYTYADLIYNGSVDDTFTGETLKIKDGTLTLVDTDNDGKFELIKAEEYIDVSVSSISVKDKKVYSKHSPDTYITIPYGEYDYFSFTDSEGKAVDPSTIKEGAVLSVFKSKDNSSVRMVYRAETAEALVSTITENEKGRTVIGTSDGAEYVLSSTYMDMQSVKSTVYVKPELGTTYTVYLNYEGYAAMIEEIASRTQYAYFMGMMKGEGLERDDTFLKLHLETNDTAKVKVAEKLTINKVKNQTSADIWDTKLLNNSGEAVPQLVMITLNSKGELTDISIHAAYDSTNSFGFDLENFSLDYTYSSVSSMYSGGGARNIMGGYCVDASTKFFVVKRSEQTLSTTDEAEVDVIDYNTYTKRYGTAWVQLYDANETWLCKAALISKRISSDGRMFVVDNASTIIDEYGETKIRVSGWWKNNYWGFREAKSGVFTDAVSEYGGSGGPLPGDVFEIAFDIDENIDSAQLIYSPKRDTSPDYCFVDVTDGSLTNFGGSNMAYMLGYPYTREDYRVGIYCKENENYISKKDYTTMISPEKYWINLLGTSHQILKFDCATGKLSLITKEEIPTVGMLTDSGAMITVDPNTKILMARSRSVVYDAVVFVNMDKD